MEIRIAAVDEAHRRWNSYDEPRTIPLTFGFVEGAVWADSAPDGDLDRAAELKYPAERDASSFLNERHREGFILGAKWVGDRKSTSIKSDPNAPLQFYAAVVFNPSGEGIEGLASFGRDLEALKSTIAGEVDRLNAEEPREFGWKANSYYPAASSTVYGGFAWARIYEVYEGQVFSFSEFI